jgi:hypothetical protein
VIISSNPPYALEFNLLQDCKIVIEKHCTFIITAQANHSLHRLEKPINWAVAIEMAEPSPTHVTSPKNNDMEA